MTTQPVDAVFFWRLSAISVFKAVYGRKPRDSARSTYTKDFHQPRRDLARALERALGIGYGGDTRVEWRWPGGSDLRGRYKAAADFAENGGRMNLRWETDRAPAPWRLTPNPTKETLATLAGTPDLDTEQAADEQFYAIERSGEQPWLLAVHLSGEGPVLHARVVLEHPMAGREFAAAASLPTTVQTAMQNLPSRAPGGFCLFEQGAAVANALVDAILQALSGNPNVLLVGPPGTGKTVAMQQVASLYDPDTPTETVLFDPDLLHDAFETLEVNPNEERRVEWVLFHPSYGYEHFVMGLLPEADDLGVTVKPHVGPLLELAVFASKPEHNALLVIDEFNRGHAAAIFGDTLALLDQDKRTRPDYPGARIRTPYGDLQPSTASGEILPALIGLPSSLRILAAMNSADRSVAPLDAALRRRFTVVHVVPDLDVLSRHLGADYENGFVLRDPATWISARHIAAVAVELLRSLNQRIEFVLGRDFLLGQSVFWHVSGVDRADMLTSLAVAVDGRVLGTLTLTFTDDDEGLAAVLNVPEDSGGLGVARWEEPPSGLQRWPRRLRIGGLQQLMGNPRLLIGALLALLGEGGEDNTAAEPLGSEYEDEEGGEEEVADLEEPNSFGGE